MARVVAVVVPHRRVDAARAKAAEARGAEARLKTPGAVVLGLDPGFASLGWALVRLTPHHEEPLACGVIRTRKGYRKGETLASSDLHRRGRELAGILALIMRREAIVAICAESLSFVRSAKTMQQVGRAWGLIDAFATATDLPLVECSPVELKVAVCNDPTASKADVEKALRKRYPHAPWAEMLTDVTGAQREHAFDALGAVVACSASNVCRMARQMVG